MKLLTPQNWMKATRDKGGFMLSESLFALAISAVSLSSVMLLNSHGLMMVKSTRDSSAATLCLQERVEQLRIANWRQITGAEYLKATYFATVPRSIAPLEGTYTETITISAYPDATVSPQLIVEKRNRQTGRVLSSGEGLPLQRLARIDVDIRWQRKNGRERFRQMSTIINNGGLSRMNLPAMGPAGGGTSAPAAGTTSSTTASTATTTSTSGSTTSSTPAATSPSNATNRGNFPGKKGQG